MPHKEPLMPIEIVDGMALIADAAPNPLDEGDDPDGQPPLYHWIPVSRLDTADANPD